MNGRRQRVKKALESREELGGEDAGVRGMGKKIRESHLKEGGEVTGWGWQGQEELGKRRTASYLIAERLQLFSQVAGGITGRKLAFTWMLIPLFLPAWQDECLLSW